MLLCAGAVGTSSAGWAACNREIDGLLDELCMLKSVEASGPAVGPTVSADHHADATCE